MHSPTNSDTVRVCIEIKAFDLPFTSNRGKGHQAQSKRCSHCETLTTSPFPENGTAEAQYSSAVVVGDVTLSQEYFLIDERVYHILCGLVEVSISSGILHNWIICCSQQLAPAEEQIKTALQTILVPYQDEKGLYVIGLRYWMHITCTFTLTHYEFHPKRGREVMNAISIAPGFTWVSVHHLRELRTQNDAQVRQRKRLNSISPLMQVSKQGHKKRKIVDFLLAHLWLQRAVVLDFLRNAERDIRMIKVQQKVSNYSCISRESPPSAVSVIILSTIRQQGHPLLSLLEIALLGYPTV